ncbi:hypothetical protein [Haloglycomyces albus]|uniref:hypothetical protein n=1 Tax=Haloglycomyces albus TaxID=526067 RepID=UPI00046CFDC0|nr:hypothetical protein [Haloglycomyces albus]
MSRYSDYLVSAASDLTLTEILRRPVDDLLGVGPDAAASLQSVAISTIFDLGTSTLFAQAEAAAEAPSEAVNLVSSEILDPDITVPIEEIPNLPLNHLRGIDPAIGTTIQATLHVETIRDLAYWPPRHTAREMVAEALGTDLGDVEEETAEELRPRFGEYPTERVYYDSLLMLGHSHNEENLTPLSGPVDLGELAAGSVGFGTPAVGALATYTQSWFAQGITLGHMIHSLALAPGEATRVAVVDWSRRTRAEVSESVSESERLDSSLTHARAVSEVQNAVAEEMQSGGSITSGWAASSSSAKGYSASVGGGGAGIYQGVAGVLGFGGGGSKSSQQSESSSRATSTSWSVGSRSVMAEMSQRVNDRTEQHSTAVRNRRASAVREVSQAEHEQVSTRVVANYNHMHALTVQYYEVVQIYRVAVRLNRFTRVLFIPFTTLDFRMPGGLDVVARFRSQLLDAALNNRVASLLIDNTGVVDIHEAVRVRRPVLVADEIMAEAGTDLDDDTEVIVDTDAAERLTSEAEAIETASQMPFPVTTRPGPLGAAVPGDARLRSIAFENTGITRVRIDRAGIPADDSTFVVTSGTDRIDFTSEILLREVDAVHVTREGGSPRTGTMLLHYETGGRERTASIPLNLRHGTHMQRAAYLFGDDSDRETELMDHLQDNRSYYTQAVFAGLDSASLVQLLSGLSWQDEPLTDQIEPNPVAVTGNYLVLRAPAEPSSPSGLDDCYTWSQLLDARGVDFGAEDARLVPIPTGGVFAEAVLGRSNSAEKLDITRFWNWQDSPIPLEPPDISGVTTGSRARDEDLTPGQLGQPVVNLQNATPLPDPSGVSAALNAIANGNMFRDMSGLAGSQDLAAGMSKGTLAAATEAGRIASENFQASTRQATQMGQAAADLFKMSKGAGSGSGSGGSGDISTDSPSVQGAKINHGRDLDERGVSGSDSSGIEETIFAARQPDRSGGDPTANGGGFSRDLAYSDGAAGASPHLIGHTAAALGQGGGGGGSTSSAQKRSVAYLVGDAMEFPLRLMFLQDAKALDMDILPENVLITPMRKHKNSEEFEPIYSGWTDGPNDVYFNYGKAVEAYFSRKPDIGPDYAMSYMRFFAVLVLRHEGHHIRQFRDPQKGRPVGDDGVKRMIEYEVEAYGDDVQWLSNAEVQNRLKQDIGIFSTDIDYLYGIVDAAFNYFDSLAKSSRSSEGLMDELQRTDKLPWILNGNSIYSMADLYQTED